MDLSLQPQFDCSESTIAQPDDTETAISPSVETAPEPDPFLLSLHELEAEMLELSQAIDQHLSTVSGKIIQIMGTCIGEGTTTISRAFATISAMRLDKKVLLVTEPSQTLESDATETAPLGNEYNDASITMPPAPVWSTPRPSILYSPRVRDVFYNLRQHHDLIVIDSLPALASTDSFAISQHVDGTILIVEAEKTRWSMVQRVKDRLIKAGGNPLGIILNKRCYHIPPSIYKFL